MSGHEFYWNDVVLSTQNSPSDGLRGRIWGPSLRPWVKSVDSGCTSGADNTISTLEYLSSNKENHTLLPSSIKKHIATESKKRVKLTHTLTVQNCQTLWELWDSAPRPGHLPGVVTWWRGDNGWAGPGVSPSQANELPLTNNLGTLTEGSRLESLWSEEKSGFDVRLEILLSDEEFAMINRTLFKHWIIKEGEERREEGTFCSNNWTWKLQLLNYFFLWKGIV